MDIYEVLNGIITEPHYYSMSHLFITVDGTTIDEKDRMLFDLLSKTSSMGTRISNIGIVYNSMINYKDGGRKFNIEDITDADYQTLEKIEFGRLPLALRSRISDILWTQKKNYSASKIAAQSYWEAFQQLYLRMWVKRYRNTILSDKV